MVEKVPRDGYIVEEKPVLVQDNVLALKLSAGNIELGEDLQDYFSI